MVISKHQHQSVSSSSSSRSSPSIVIISRQQRRMQVMRIRQRDDRHRKKKKKQQHGSSHLHHQAKQLQAEPVYRRKPNPIRRYDTDVLSPVRGKKYIYICVCVFLKCFIVNCQCFCPLHSELYPEFSGPTGTGAAFPWPAYRRRQRGAGCRL